MNFRSIKPAVFLPPFLLLLAAVAYSLHDARGFVAFGEAANAWILARFGWLFNVGTLTMLAVCVWIYFSPLANIRIGGPDAKPTLTRMRWFSITLCTTVAIGILFWGTSEPVMHLRKPPASLGLAPGSPDAVRFALSTLFLHWTFTPYAVYAVPALMFALAYYNMGRSFSLGAPLSPLFGNREKGGRIVDSVCLYIMVTGMAASLGTGVLSLAGGLENLFGDSASGVFAAGFRPWLLALITILIVSAFILSAASGLMNGIRILSEWNVRVFVAIGIFVFVVGPTAFILNLGTEAFGDYLTNFFRRSLFTGAASGDPWPGNWTIFYWSNWLAWAPVTGLFLGRISYGYTVRDFLRVNLLFPALFVAAWMAIFGGTALHLDLASKGELFAILEKSGPEAAVYAVFDKLPWARVMVIVFLLTSFLSYVTAADSNTAAMSGVSSAGISPNSPEPPLFVKILWGTTIGAVAWVMISYAGVEGVRIISKLGGFPALLLVLAVTFALIRVSLSPRKFFNSRDLE